MSLLLQIETATTACSVALTEDGRLLALRELNERNRHAEVITLFIDEVMHEAGKSWPQLDAVAVSCGPGSYTGLRIGVSTAKGLCYAAGKPLIAIETLPAMASGLAKDRDLKESGELLCPMIDARRMEVYTALYTADGECVMPVAAKIITADSFAEELAQQKVIFFGDGAAKCRQVLAHQPNAVFITDFVNSARSMTDLAALKFERRQFEDVAYFEPFYLKDFIAGAKGYPR
jgi:tRNA threonylcarbamoyladenosine biosynthesis protein TsaB